MTNLKDLIKKYCPDGVRFVDVGEIVEIYTGTQLNKENMFAIADYPVINGGIEPSGYWNEYNEIENTITISQGGASAGYVNFMLVKFWAGAHCYIVRPTSDVLLNRYLYFFLKNSEKKLQESKHGAAIPGLNRDKIKSLKIPLPPLIVQQEIVRILDLFTELTTELTTELGLRKKQYEYYRNSLLSFTESVVGGGGGG